MNNMEAAFKIVFAFAIFIFCLFIIGLFLLIIKMLLLAYPELNILGITMTRQY